MKNRLYAFVLALLAISFTVTAQSSTDTTAVCNVSGKVIDLQGNTLPGANIIVENTSYRAVTDNAGQWNLIVPAGKEYRITISFIGMKNQTLTLRAEAGRKNMRTVRMAEEDNPLEEVVVTGYTYETRARSTGAYTQVKMADLMQPQALSVDQMLAGKIPGLSVMQTSGDPTATPKIRIRGTSTILGTKAPLWVLDGIILTEDVTVDHTQLNGDDANYLVGNAIAGVNPQDIESITVLKDAAAAALYGVQAANGVIVVTTKKGQVGRPQITYNGSVSITDRIGYSDIDLMNAGERIRLSQQLIESGVRYSTANHIYGYEGLYSKYLGGQLSKDEFVSNVYSMAAMNTDWYDILFRDAVSSNHTVSISGGSERVRYYTSLAYNGTQSSGINNDTRRYNFNTKVNAWLVPERLYLGMSLAAYDTKSTGYSSLAGVNPNDYAYRTSRTIPCYNADGSLFMYERVYADGSDYATGIDGLTRSNLQYNILNEIDQTGQSARTGSYAANLNLRWYLLLKLAYEMDFNFTSTHREVADWANEGSSYISSLRGWMYGEVPRGSLYEELSPLPRGGLYSQDNQRVQSYTVRNQLRFNTDIAKYHTFSALASSEVRSANTYGLSSVNYGWLPNRGKTFSPMLTASYISDLLTSPTMTDVLNNYVSWIGNAMYSYKDKLSVQGNIRADGSNQFGTNPKYRFLPCWSVSGKYTLSNEEFMKRQSFITYLAFRASYGIQGNVDTGSSPDMVFRLGATNEITGLDQNYIEYLPNENLRWEKTASYNLGVDFALLRDRISTTVDVYSKNGTDMIMSADVSQATGVQTIKVNYGGIRNSGVDVGMRITPYKSRVWESNIQLNYGYVKNTLVKANPNLTYSFSDMASGNALLEGHEIGAIYSYPFAGLDAATGYPLFYNKDGATEGPVTVTNPSTGETSDIIAKNYALYADEIQMVKSGTTTPPHFGGITLSGRWRDLRLTAGFTFSWGAVGRLPFIYSSTSAAFTPFENVTKDYIDRWYKPGDELYTDMPKLYDYIEYAELQKRAKSRTRGTVYQGIELYNNSTARIASTDILRFSSLNLSYRLHGSWLAKAGISDMQLSLHGTNLCFWADKAWNGRDPESGAATIPVQPSYTFNVNINF